MNSRKVLLPPRYFSHENLEFGNVIKVNFEPINEAIGYIIEKSIDENITFEYFTFVNENSFIDYTINEFSDYNKELNYYYRISPIGNLNETNLRFSRSYKVTIPKMPLELLNVIEGEIETHSKTFTITNNKETKFLIQNSENNLNVYKTSTLSNEPEKNDIENKILGDSSKPIKVISPSTDEGFYLLFSSGTIQYIDKINLFPLITFNTYGKEITKLEVNNENSLIVILENNLNKQLTIYEKNNLFIKEIPITNQKEIIKNKILDIKVRKNDIYIVDQNSNFYVLEFNSDYGTLKLKHKFFKNDSLNPFSIFKKKAYQLKNVIIDFINQLDYLNLIEKELFKTSFLNNPRVDEYIIQIQNYIEETSLSTNNNYEIFSNKILTIVTYLFNDFELNKKSKLTNEQVEQIINDLINSNYLIFYIKRVFYSLEQYRQYHEKYLTETKISFSEINNIIVLSSPFYFYIFDIFNYRMNNFFNVLIPNKEIDNYLIDELNIEEKIDEIECLKSMKTDRFITDLKFENGKIGISFEDIMSYYILDETNLPQIEHSFSNKYIDFYNMDYKGNYTDLIISDKYNDLFTSLKGFGNDYIKFYSINSSIFKGEILTKDNKFYSVKKDLFYFERELPIQEQFDKEIKEGYLIEIPSEQINHFSLNTRLHITSKELIYDNRRDFSFFDIEITSKFNSILTKPWLNNKPIFKNNIIKKCNVKFYFDSTAENVFAYINEPTFYSKRGKNVCLFLIDKFYLESNTIIFNEEINIKHNTYLGEINSEPLATEEQFYFLFNKNNNGEEYTFYQNIYNFNESSEINTAKIKNSILNPNYFMIDALYKQKKIDPLSAQLNYFWIYNDYQNQENSTVSYGNDKIPTWRWKRNNLLIKYENYIAFRVSIDKKEWIYLNKDITTYTSNEELNDGVHTFYLQYQDIKGNWSNSITSTYHLKTLIPTEPILEEIIYDSQERGKPLIKWLYNKEIEKYKIIYNDHLEYYPIKQNYHTPEVSFDILNSESTNIKVNVIAYDKYQNQSKPATFYFLSNNSKNNILNLYYNKYTNNPRPLIRWNFKKNLNIKEYLYSFNDEEFKSTELLFATPNEDLKEGINKFTIYAKDILNSETNKNTIYFEIKYSNKTIPKLTKQSFDKNLINIKNNIILELEYDLMDNQLLYSFDNFKNVFIFSDYKIDLTDKDLSEGNHTIYIKYIDKYGNESEITEYTFQIIDSKIIKPVFYDSYINYNHSKPKIKWYKREEYKEFEIELFKDNEILFEPFKIKSNFYIPEHNLSNGNYTIKVKAIDKYNMVSKPSEFSFNINTSIPNEIKINNLLIKNNQLTLSTESNYKTLYKFKSLKSNHITNFIEFNKDLIINNLKDNEEYELILINQNELGFNSKETSLIFKYKDNNNKKDLIIENSHLSFTYDNISKEAILNKINEIKDFELEQDLNFNLFYKIEKEYFIEEE